MSSTRKLVTGVGVALAALVGVILLLASAYTVDQAEQVVILQFGRPIGDPVSEPGLHFKTPFVQDVLRFDKRRLAPETRHRPRSGLYQLS